MVAVAQASPAVFQRLVVVRTAPTLTRAPARLPTTVYRRRRAVALLIAVSVAVVLIFAVGGLLASFGGGPLTASEHPGAHVAGAVYVVQPGDTFWEIARRIAPEEDPRPLVARLVAEHGSPTLLAGERLRLPAAA